jgi:recombination protein RecA
MGKGSIDLTQDIIQHVNAAHGEGKALALSSPDLSIHIPGVVSTGSEWLDWSLGRGGVPLGRISMIGGNEGTGKTTIALNLCRSIQQMGGVAFYVDAEYKLDVDYARDLGVDTDKLILSQPDHMEQALETIQLAVERIKAYREKTGTAVPALVVLDSLNAMATKAELEGSLEDQHYAPQARVMSKALKRLAGMLSKESIALFMISQLREKIGVMFGDTHDTACGKAPKFYSTCIIHLTGGSSVTEGGDKVANVVHAKVVKNQVAPPFRKCKVMIRYGKGIDRAHAVHEGSKASGVVTVNGSWHSIGKHKWQGLTGLEKVAADQPDILDDIVKLMREPYGWDA